MLNNFYDKVKKFISETYKTIIFSLILYLILMFPVNYFIITGGGIMEVGDRIVVEDEYKSKGSFNLAYVKEAKGTIATYLLSYVMPDWKRVKASDYTIDKKESIEDINKRSNIDLLNVSSFAIKNAYEEANKNYIVTNKDFYIYYLDKKNKSKLKVGDKLVKIDNTKIDKLEDITNNIESHNENDIIKTTIIRNEKEKDVLVKLYKIKDKVRAGMYINEVDSYKTYPKVKIKFRNSESGPSGGLIETLDIYNKLIKKDITKGLKIAGTGEIDNNGKIITIGEVKYKLLGAVSKNADIFIVPKGENYKTCMKVKKDKKLKIKIIGVSTFKEAIEKINSI